MLGQAANYDDLFPAAMSRYNGKPTLINKSGELYFGEQHGESYMEMDVFAGRFSLFARQSIHNAVMPKVRDIDLQIGIVLEGQADEELPEVLIGGVHLDRCDWETACPELGDL